MEKLDKEFIRESPTAWEEVLDKINEIVEWINENGRISEVMMKAMNEGVKKAIKETFKEEKEQFLHD